MENLHNKSEKIDAHTLVQHLAALSQRRQMVQAEEGGETAKKHVSRLEKELEEQVKLWGGISKIENWLKANDPASAMPSSIKDFDLSMFDQ
jgi:hypothetical protein